MARTTKEEAQKTKRRILDKAADLFYKQGVSATTLEQIAEAASLTRGAIYWHFNNKLDVIRAIHDDLYLPILLTLFKEFEDSSLSPIQRLKQVSKQFMKSLATDQTFHHIISIFFLKCDYSGEMADFLKTQNESKKQGIALTTACFAEAIKIGEVPDRHTPEFLAKAHIYFITGLITEAVRFPENFAKNTDEMLAYHFSAMTKA